MLTPRSDAYHSHPSGVTNEHACLLERRVDVCCMVHRPHDLTWYSLREHNFPEECTMGKALDTTSRVRRRTFIDQSWSASRLRSFHLLFVLCMYIVTRTCRTTFSERCSAEITSYWQLATAKNYKIWFNSGNTSSAFFGLT